MLGVCEINLVLDWVSAYHSFFNELTSVLVFYHPTGSIVFCLDTGCASYLVVWLIVLNSIGFGARIPPDIGQVIIHVCSPWSSRAKNSTYLVGLLCELTELIPHKALRAVPLQC